MSANRGRQTMSQHTPGPWTVENVEGETFITVGPPTGSYIAQVSPYHHLVEHTAANARLIAAAPEMYALIRGFFTCDDAGCEMESHLRAQEILDKIDGK